MVGRLDLQSSKFGAPHVCPKLIASLKCWKKAFSFKLGTKVREGANREKLTVKKLIDNEMFFFHRLCPLQTVKNRRKPWKNRHQTVKKSAPKIHHFFTVIFSPFTSSWKVGCPNFADPTPYGSNPPLKTLWPKTSRLKKNKDEFLQPLFGWWRRGVLAEEVFGYPRHQNDYMQLFLFSGNNFLMITVTITFLNPLPNWFREM